MQIIPVLDLKGGLVVRGVAGLRDAYRPIESRLCSGSRAGDMARGLNAAFGFDTCYVADLDAIAGGDPCWSLYDEVAAAGLVPWIDAGTGSPATAGRLSNYLAARNPAGRVVVGLESVADSATLAEIVRAIRPERAVFSLDLKRGEPLSTSPAWQHSEPAQIAAAAVELGINSFIVLDLAGVGMGQGVPTLALCRRLRAEYPELEIVSGGGVRGIDDLEAMRAAGCNGALVASALHDGRITPEGLVGWVKRQED
jgi:phosphoribosylformimino-5-aminoimidazole carboxamide ribotide isomerase